MRKPVIQIIMLAIMIFGGCRSGPNDAESPGQALLAIIQLYQNQDFDTLICSRYAEIEKAENQEQVQALVDRFQRQYSNDENRSKAIAIYKALLDLQPEITDGGTTAIYRLDKGFVRLSRMPDGKWGFHL